MGVIYLITNKINNKQYIGLTTQHINRRMSQHFSAAKLNPVYLIDRAIAKHGWENFTLIILDETNDFDELKNLEIMAIKNFQTKYPLGYNMTDGGEGSVGWKPTEEQKAKQSAALKNRTHSEESKKKISETHKGVIFSEEHKRNISLAKTGKKLPSLSEERKKLQSENAKGNTNWLGKKHSKESIEKMRLAAKEAWKKRKEIKNVSDS